MNNVSADNYSHECAFTNEWELKCWWKKYDWAIDIPIWYSWKKLTTLWVTCWITIQWDLKCWWPNWVWQINIPFWYKWKYVESGWYHTCWITNDDDLKCWWDNYYWQINIPTWYKWKYVSTWLYNTCWITNDDELKCWWYNRYWQINVPFWLKLKNISTWWYHTCWITNDDELKCWWANWDSQITFPTWYKWKAINSGYNFTCWITNDDELKCWWNNKYFQTNVPTWYKWKDIDTWYNFTCWITIDNELKCWWVNWYWQLDFPIWYKWHSFTENIEIQPIQIPTPTNLNQYIQSPLLEREEIQVWSKIGKFQSWSWVIFETEIDNPESKELRINLELYKKWETTTKYTYTSDYSTISWKVFTKIPLEAWDYYWKLKIEDRDWNTSEIVDFKDNWTDIDFSIFEWFEPYPYGFSFVNSGISNWLLDWWIIWYNFNKDDNKFDFRYKNDWKKWEIFNYLFPESMFENKYEMFDMFESMWLDNKNPDIFYNWNCHWLSLISSTYKKYPLKINEISNEFYNTIGSWTIYDNISLSTNFLWKWNDYDEKLKTILISQLVQLDPHFVFTKKYYRENKNPIDILNELKVNPDKSYILSFWWAETSSWKVNYHTVVPYRIEWNKIYIYDNNVPYPNYEYENGNYNAYEQYIEVYWNWKNDFKIKLYNDEAFWFSYFTDMSIVDLDLIYWETENKAMWFNNIDTLYTLSWNNEIIIKDELWRISWYKDWQIYEEIPGTIFVRNYWVTLDTIDKENTWKQIYLPQKLENLTIEINGKVDENYDLMIAWWDYYTKLEWIATSSWQTDTFNISRENIKIDLDDTKTNSWTYNILVDDFQNNWTWSVYIDSMKINTNLQQYNINWPEVINNTSNSVNYQIDINNDGNFDTNTNFSPIYQDNISPITTYNLIWTQTPNTTNNSYVETLNIELNSIDNENWTWVEKIYYSLDNIWTTDKIYLEYNNPIQVNGIWNYTLSYYALDKFWNKEEVKTINFTLTEKPETYAWNISWYIYDDSNQNIVLDSWEKTMAWWKVCIDKNNNNDCEENSEPFNVTNNNWYYEFDSLSTWTYNIKLIPHQNWILTNPISWRYTITLSNWQVVTNKNFWAYKTKWNK